MPRLIRTVVWKRNDAVSIEHFGLWRDSDGWQLRGTLIAAIEDKPLRIRYGVICDVKWRTRAVHIAMRRALIEEPVHISVGEDGVWHVDGPQLPPLEPFADADISLTPATNTLPIRRLALEVGQSTEVEAGWIGLPELQVEPLQQTYTRVDSTLYRYRSGSFEADMEVDELGLIVRYGDIWERVAVWDAPFHE